MKIVIPTSDTVPDRVLESLQAQSLNVDVHVFKTSEKYVRDQTKKFVEEMHRRYQIIGKIRTQCLPELCTEEITVLNDRNLVHINSDNLKEMYDLLMSDDRIVAVSLAWIAKHWYKLHHAHMRNGCVMARRKVWENADFIPPNCGCTCIPFAKSARKLGDYRYLDLDTSRVKKIKGI